MLNPFDYLYSLFNNYKLFLLLLCIHPLLKSFFFIFPAFVIKKLTDCFIIIEKNIAIQLAIYFIKIYFFIIIINFIYLRLYQYYIQIKLLPLLRKNIVLECVLSLLKNTKFFFNNNSSAELAHFLIHLNDNIIDIINLFFEKILYNIFTLFFIIICFFYYNIYCAICILCWFFIIFLITIYMIFKIKKINSKIIIDKVLISKFLIDLFNNITLVQVFLKEKYELDLLAEKAIELELDEKKVAWYYFSICFFYYFSFIVMQIISLYILCKQYLLGIIFASDIVFWWTLSGMLFILIDDLINNILQLPKYYMGIEEALGSLKSEVPKAIVYKKFVFNGGKIEFKNVYFSFENKHILENFSLIIEPREKIAIVGFSGSGKTTLIFLLLRIYIPDSGTIYIDDYDINYIDKLELYDIFSVILQENNILDRTILENIVYSEQNNNENFDKEKIYSVLSSVELNEFKDEIKKTLDGFFSIESKLLSGGQKQRISIARAIYKKANIFLFDEPTSSLDLVTENKIFSIFKNITINSTLIIVTHKLAIITWMPRIIVFERGKIIEDGTHEKLLEKNGLYKKLFNLEIH